MCRVYGFFLILNISGLTTVWCARILGVVPTPSFSHQVVFRPIWEQLAENGHDLVILTTDPWQTNQTNNIKQIDLNHAYKIWKDENNVVQQMADSNFNIVRMSKITSHVFLKIVESELNHPEVQKMLNNKSEHFDLLIVEYMNPLMLAFSNRFNCPYVGIVTFELPEMYQCALGNPTHPILYPDGLLPYESSLDMTFKERLVNTFMTFLVRLFPLWQASEPQQQLIEKYFGENLPHLQEIIKNVSLVLTNINPIFNKRPLGPNTVAFGGGVHLQPPKPLPKDLLEFLDGATNGCIYFSFGTNVNENSINPKMRDMFLNVFKTLPYRVLWKFNVDIPDLPKNVKISKWIPQLDVLRHPSIKLFITQAGLQSMEEAISTHIPIVAVPFFGDQPMNADKIVKRGLGLQIDKDQINEKLLKETIEEVINNPKYKAKVIETAELSVDQPLSGVDKAVWWIEYVLRHKGAKHLRNQVAMDIPLYQYLLLDTLLFLFAILSTLSYVIWKTVKWLLKKALCSKNKLKSN